MGLVRHPPRAWLPWLVVLALCAWTAAALAQRHAAPVYPDPPGQGPELAYLGSNGLGQERVTLTEVRARWGSPEVVKDAPHKKRAALHWQYPSQGLRFQVNWENRDDKNPRVGWLQVDLPFNGRTPQGLYLGMPQAEAMAIVRQHYKVRGQLDTPSSSSSAPSGAMVTVSNHGWRQTQLAHFMFSQGRLFSMGFQLKPRPWIDPGLVQRTQGLVVLAALALAAAWVYGHLKLGMGRWWRRAQGLLGVLLLGLGVWWVVAAVDTMGSGDGYSKMAGLVLALCGVGAVVVGAGMLGLAVRGRDAPSPPRARPAGRAGASPSTRRPPE